MRNPIPGAQRVEAAGPLYSLKSLSKLKQLIPDGYKAPAEGNYYQKLITEESKFVTVRKGFLQIGGPRTIVEITTE